MILTCRLQKEILGKGGLELASDHREPFGMGRAVLRLAGWLGDIEVQLDPMQSSIEQTRNCPTGVHVPILNRVTFEPLRCGSVNDVGRHELADEDLTGRARWGIATDSRFRNEVEIHLDIG